MIIKVNNKEAMSAYISEGRVRVIGNDLSINDYKIDPEDTVYVSFRSGFETALASKKRFLFEVMDYSNDFPGLFGRFRVSLVDKSGIITVSDFDKSNVSETEFIRIRLLNHKDILSVRDLSGEGNGSLVLYSPSGKEGIILKTCEDLYWSDGWKSRYNEFFGEKGGWRVFK